MVQFKGSIPGFSTDSPLLAIKLFTLSFFEAVLDGEEAPLDYLLFLFFLLFFLDRIPEVLVMDLEHLFCQRWVGIRLVHRLGRRAERD